MSNPPQPPLIMQDVHEYVINELNPLKEDLFEFWEQLASANITASEAITGKLMACLMLRHRGLIRRWREARRKTVQLDTFISPDDPKGLEKLTEFMQQPVIRQFVLDSESEVSSVMRDINDILRDLRSAADIKRSGIFTMAAILIAVASILISVLFNVFTT